MDHDHLSDHKTLHSRASAIDRESEAVQFTTESLSPPPLNVTASFELKAEPEQETDETQTERSSEPTQINDAPFQLASSIQLKEESSEEETVPETSEGDRIYDSPSEDPPDEDGDETSSSSGSSESAVLSDMEAAFNTSFSNVNLIQNSQEAEDLGAKAFTIGESIHFAPGFYDLSSEEGRTLLGHELTHVMQQREGRVEPTTEMQGFQINDNQNLENEADRLGNLVGQRKELPPFSLNRTPSSSTVSQRKIIQRDLNESDLNTAIEGLHLVSNHVGANNQYGENDQEVPHSQHDAVRILRENRDNLEQIKTAFEARYHISLRTYIRNHYTNIDMKVKATALLFDPTYTTPWTQVALALIPPLTRDGEFFRIMSNINDSQRSELRRKYNARFSTIGEGSLDADIRSDFEGEDEMRAWIISYRALTDADNIYLDTAGQIGTNVSHLVETIRRIWGYGANTFDTKLNQWNPNNNLPDVVLINGSPIQFQSYFDNPSDQFGNKISQIGHKSRSLMYTVLGEISGSTKRNIEQIFLEYIEQVAGFAQPAGDDDGGWAFTQEEESNLRIARERLEGGEFLWDDTDEINAATDEIIAIYQGRVTRLEAIDNNEENARHARKALDDVRRRLVNHHGISGLRVADRNMADEVYFVRGNRQSLENKILEYFKAGQLANLRAETAVPHSENGNIIRPAYNLISLLNIGHVRSGQIIYLIRNSGSDASRGAHFIHQTILREYVQAPTLSFLHEFINQGTWDAGLKNAIIEEYCQRHCSPNAAQLRGSAVNAFVFHLHGLGFRTFSMWPAFRDALAPALSNDVRVARAREDIREEESSTLGNIATSVSDTFTGEDTREVAHTSLQNLELFANRDRVDSDEMRVFRAFYSEELDLAGREYRMFHERLTAMRSARNQMAGLANSIVAAVLEAALAPFLSPIGSAMVAQAVGILSEWMINPEADPATATNAANIVFAGVTAGAGGSLEEGVIGRMLENNISNRYLRAAVSDAIEESFDQGAEAFAQGISEGIDRNDILNRVESILASSITGGMMNGVSVQAVTTGVIQESLDSMASNVVQEGVRSAAHTVLQPSDTEQDITNRIARTAIEGAWEGAVESIED